MKRAIVFVALLTFFAFLLGACTEPSCADQSAEVLQQMEDIAARWDDATELAGSTSRIALSGPLGEMQAIRREAEALDAPECALEAQDALVEHMDLTIEAFLMFMGDEPEEDISTKFRRANDWLDIYVLKLAEIRSESE